MHFRLPERTIERVTEENEDDVWIKAAASSIGWKACGWHIASTVFGSRRRQNTSHQPIDAGRMHENLGL